MTKKMSNETQLFIRACKRTNSAKRCESILRRFFLFGNYWISVSLTHDESFKKLIPLSLIFVPLFLSLFFGLF